MGWFHRTLCDLLDEFLAAVIAKKSPRLMIFSPPQHGKSELVSRRFPAYALGRYPHLRVIACSYAASLAFDLSRDLQNLMDSEAYHRLFPGVAIPGVFGVRGSATRRLENFGIVGHAGSYRCAGADGSLTGKSAEILIVDNPHKNAAEVHSLIIRDVLYRNFQTSLRTRVQDGGGVIVISMRWHTDDLAGRLLQNEPGRWKVVSFPAIALEDEEHRRARRGAVTRAVFAGGVGGVAGVARRIHIQQLVSAESDARNRLFVEALQVALLAISRHELASGDGG
jgi:hypothetical protein